MTQKIDADTWERVCRDYDAGNLTLIGIARKHRVPVELLREHVRTHRWNRELHTEARDRLILIERLLGVVERQVQHMETQEMTPTGEMEAAVLGKLTSSLGALIRLAKAEAQTPQAKLETAEMREVRKQLEKRINALTKG